MFVTIISKLFIGFLTTIEIFALTLVLALPLGLIVAFGSMSKFKPLKWTIRGFVWIIRGTPLMLQLLLVCYGPGLIGLPAVRDEMVAVIVAFVINYACYFSEIYRGGIESIAKGQYEAGQVLGLKKSQVFFQIVLFQVIKRILAPMSNEIITLVKDTALARVIAITELLKAAETYASYGLIWPMFYTAVFYLAFVGLLTLFFGYFEKKLSYYRV